MRQISKVRLRTLAAMASPAILLCVSGYAQRSTPPTVAAGPALPVFEVADVHGSARTQYPSVRGGGLHGDRYLLRQATMVDLIAVAYKVDPLNVIGGPAWLELDRFDIVAKVPRATSQETSALMLRSLLGDRFKLDVQADTRPLPAYVLTAGKSPKLKQAEGSGEQFCNFQQPAKDAAPAARMNITFACRNTTMEEFAQFLHNVGRPYMARPVVDATQLKGAWDFEFQWSFQPPRAGADGITIFDALEKQLGLKLELKSTPLSVVVVNSVNEAPTPNPPEVAEALPPRAPAEFEVAIIRPHAPKEKHFGISINGGNINVQFGSLETLISFAWDIDKEMIVRGSYVLTEDRDFFDITGKASTDAPAGPGSGPGVDIDDLREMMRSLLAERFQLKVHAADLPFDAYTLYAASPIPKMKKADPANRASCKPGPGPDGKDPRVDNPALTRLISCQNVTMSQFAAQLRTLAPGNIKTEVLDKTGLTGAYDFTLYWSGENDGPGAAPPPGEAASDPSRAIPYTEALNKQLGLKLEKQKRPVSMLVIDHIEQKPTEN